MLLLSAEDMLQTSCKISVLLISTKNATDRAPISSFKALLD